MALENLAMHFILVLINTALAYAQSDQLHLLESAYSQLNATCSAMQQEFTDMKHQNRALREQVRNLTAIIQAQAHAVIASTDAATSTPAPTTTAKVRTVYTHCTDAFNRGNMNSGVYLLQPFGFLSPKEFYCDMTSHGGGWIVIQRRFNGSVSFNRDWTAYKNGFGSVHGEFWIGNDVIYKLTRRIYNQLLIKLEDWTGKEAYELYKGFRLAGEASHYSLNVIASKGTAGDSFNYRDSYSLRHNGQAFSTPDRDHDSSFQRCAERLQSGWWFNDCYSSNLNGHYLNQPHGHHQLGETVGQPVMTGTGIEWYPWKHQQYSLKATSMMIKV